jgi:hypothetical protein
VNGLRIEVESSSVVRICRGSVLVTRAPVDRQGILWNVSLEGCGLTADEINWLVQESGRAMRAHTAKRPGFVARLLIRLRNRLVGRPRLRVTHPTPHDERDES